MRTETIPKTCTCKKGCRCKETLPPGMTGYCVLHGSNYPYEFICGGKKVILRGFGQPDKETFQEIVKEITKIDFCPICHFNSEF